MNTDKSIVNHLSSQWRESGVQAGDLLLVHSSLRRLLKKLSVMTSLRVTPQHIYDSLMTSVGSKGTLILPLFNFDFPKTKEFNINKTPSHMGALTEIGRFHPDSIRTGHPIYSFAVRGKHAAAFTGINNESGYGPDSPFAKLRELGGKIAIIGLDDQNSMTSYHFVEEQNQVDYRYYKQFVGQYTDWDGQTEKRTYSLFVRDIERGVTTDVNRMMDRLWEKGLFKGEKYNEGYGMRTIDFNAFYEETDKVIKSGEAINYLYSIQNA